MSTFVVGDKVRVRAGTSDPENPDLSIGSWCGVIDEVEDSEQPAVYLVRWDERTRQHMPAVFLNRCQAENLEIDHMWLDEEQLEADQGELIPLPPVTGSLRLTPEETERDERLRAVFNLAPGDEVPEVNAASLATFHAYLSSRLTFPFKAHLVNPMTPSITQEVNVARLMPFGPLAGVESGLAVEVEAPQGKGEIPLFLVGCDADSPQGQLAEDYRYWVMNWSRQSEQLQFPGAADGMPTPRLPMSRLLQLFGMMGTVYGATLGAIAAVVESSRLAMIVGASAGALLVGLAGRRLGIIYGTMRGSKNGAVIGMVVGMGLGGMLGVLIGALAVVFVGSIIGSIVGSLLADGLVRHRRGMKFVGLLLGACIGGVVFAVIQKREEALTGALVGGVIGLIAGMVLVLATLATLIALLSRRR